MVKAIKRRIEQLERATRGTEAAALPIVNCERLADGSLRYRDIATGEIVRGAQPIAIVSEWMLKALEV